MSRRVAGHMRRGQHGGHHHDSVAAQSVGAFMLDLASSRSTPGGGAAAAIALGMARALLSMSCGVTARRAEESEAARLLRVADRETEGAVGALDLADGDAYAFDQIMTAYALPRQGLDDKVARRAALAKAAAEAIGLGRHTADEAIRGLEMAGEIAQTASASILSDVRAAVSLFQASLLITLENLRGNAALLPSEVAKDVLPQVDALEAVGREHARVAVARLDARAARA